MLLSACNTAAAEDGDAEGLLGLARTFFFPGARSLLVSHWAVNDTVAIEIMAETLQRSRATDISKAEALRQAMRKPGRN